MLRNQRIRDFVLQVRSGIESRTVEQLHGVLRADLAYLGKRMLDLARTRLRCLERVFEAAGRGMGGWPESAAGGTSRFRSSLSLVAIPVASPRSAICCETTAGVSGATTMD